MKNLTNTLISLGVIVVFAVFAIFMVPSPAKAALNLSLETSFGSHVDGLTYNPTTDTIFGINSDLISPNPIVVEWNVIEYTPSGRRISEFTSDAVNSALGGSTLPNGNILIVSPLFGQIVEFTPDGDLVPGGINIRSDALASSSDTSAGTIYKTNAPRLRGIEYSPNYDIIYLLDPTEKNILAVDTDGYIFDEIDLTNLLPEKSCPQALAIDPVTENFLVGDQSPEERCAGTDSIYEISSDGYELLSVINIEDFGFGDLEGLSIDPYTDTLYAGFDEDDEEHGSIIAAFHISRSSTAPSGGNFSQSCNNSSIQGSTLYSTCRRINGSYNDTSINLNSVIENIDGSLKWQPSNFIGSCRYTSLTRSSIMTAQCRTRSQRYVNTSINLDDHIANINGVLKYQ